LVWLVNCPEGRNSQPISYLDRLWRSAIAIEIPTSSLRAAGEAIQVAVWIATALRASQ
jgi:hypothetical protein